MCRPCSSSNSVLQREMGSLEFRPLDHKTCNIDRELVFLSLAKFAMLRHVGATCQRCPDSQHADSSKLKDGLNWVKINGASSGSNEHLRFHDRGESCGGFDSLSS